MLCPNCGTRMTNEHKFCRHCGMNLEPVSRALTAHLSHGGAAAREAERRAVRRMTNGLIASVVVILFGVLLLAFLPGRGFKFLGVATALVGIVAAMVSVLSPLRHVGGAGAGAGPAAFGGAEGPPEGRLLHETRFQPPPSVTDHTTELLGAEVRDREPGE